MPAPKRRYGYYALPLLWGHEVVGWVNAQAKEGKLHVSAGLATLKRKPPVFVREFEEELERFREFLDLDKVAKVRWLR